MMTYAPIKQKWTSWADQEGRPFFKQCKDNDTKIEKALQEVKDLGARKLHYGRSHKTNTKRCKLPENMLIYLWLLRYMVFDETTLTNAKLFFSPDLLKYEDDKDNVFHAEWIKNNILLPCLDVIQLISTKNTKTHQVFQTHLCYSKGDLTVRIKECVMHNLVADMIKTIIRNGFPVLTAANTDVQKQNIDEIKATIRKFNSQYNQDSELIWGAKQDLYTVFFQAIPYMIERNIEQHWKIMTSNFFRTEQLTNERFWPQGISMSNFKLLLPLENDKHGVDGLTICEFFDAIKAGNVSPTLLFIRPEPKSDNSKKRQLRELKQKNYIEAKSDDEQSEGTNDANYRKNETEENEEEDTQTKEKNKKRAKTIRSPASKDKQTVSGTPNKKQAAKSAEKLSIEEDIAVTEKEFDTAFNAFKDELKYDESKINKSLLISKMSEMSALWRLFKRQISDYKNLK